jgi:MFS family permease
MLGTIYDIFGRKTPILVFLVISCLAFSSLPFLESVFELYIFAILEIPIGVLISNPFIPDLIDEESHGVANMLRTNTINVANLSAYSLLLLNATNLPIFHSDMIFFFVTLFLLCTFILVKIGMKDVIKEGNRMTESLSQEVNVRYVVN